MHTKRPPRLRDFDYLGFYRYFLTLCIEGRRRPFEDLDAGRRIVDQFLQHAGASAFAVIACCVMPDHLHALVKGTAPNADFKDFVGIWKQRTAYEWKQRTGERLWQEGYFDRVLRDEDADLWVVRYIASNPVRQGLAESPEQYPLFGSSVYSMEEFLKALKGVGAVATMKASRA